MKVWVVLSIFFAMGAEASDLKAELRKIATERANCERKECDKLDFLKRHERALKELIKASEKIDLLSQENRTLRTQALQTQANAPSQGGRAPASAGPSATKVRCQKKAIFDELMFDHGIATNGNLVYSKQPMGVGGAECWANSRKKKEATVTLCQFPISIQVRSKGGESSAPTIREREYFFNVKNECDVVSVRIKDQSRSGTKETYLPLSKCVEAWNKRTADALMTKTQVLEMEDTIGFCFRERLLPPSTEEGGFKNPAISPDDAKLRQPAQNPTP